METTPNPAGPSDVPGKVTSAVQGGSTASTQCDDTSPHPTVQADGHNTHPASPLPDTGGTVCGGITRAALTEALQMLPEWEAKRIERENKLFRRLLTEVTPVLLQNNELDRATPPNGWSTWEKFVNGEPRDVE